MSKLMYVSGEVMLSGDVVWSTDSETVAIVTYVAKPRQAVALSIEIPDRHTLPYGGGQQRVLSGTHELRLIRRGQSGEDIRSVHSTQLFVTALVEAIFFGGLDKAVDESLRRFLGVRAVA